MLCITLTFLFENIYLLIPRELVIKDRNINNFRKSMGKRWEKEKELGKYGME